MLQNALVLATAPIVSETLFCTNFIHTAKSQIIAAMKKAPHGLNVICLCDALNLKVRLLNTNALKCYPREY